MMSIQENERINMIRNSLMPSILFIVFLLSFCRIVCAASVDIDIIKDLRGEINSLVSDARTNLVEFESEFYNIGSIPYSARMRIDVYEDDRMIFTGWGREEDFIPGHRRINKIYWYSNDTGKFTARARVYYAKEILILEKEFEKTSSGLSESAFEIRGLRTYDDYIVFDVTAREDASNLVILPSGFPPGWIFEQKTINSMEKDSTKTVLLNYEPTVWAPSNLKLSVASDDGKYYSESEFELKRESGIFGAINYLIDSIRLLFQK